MIFLSVIIPTRNRSSLLSKTINSLLAQSYPKDQFEIIVVDNGSTDTTKEVTLDFKKKFSNIKYFFRDTPGLHVGRHTGLFESSGEILVYVDDDIDALPGFLMAIDDSFKSPKVGLVGGKDIPEYESPAPSWLEEFWEKAEHGKYLPYLSLLDFGNQILEINPDFVFGCNFSIRKEILIKSSGFHPDGMPEQLLRYRGDGETYVGRKVKQLGFTTIYHPKVSVKHWVPSSRMTLEYFKKRAFASGISYSFSVIREGKKRQGFIRSFLGKLKLEKEILFASKLKAETKRAFDSGFQFHQSEVARDKDLSAWVLKENYLDS